MLCYFCYKNNFLRRPLKIKRRKQWSNMCLQFWFVIQLMTLLLSFLVSKTSTLYNWSFLPTRKQYDIKRLMQEQHYLAVLSPLQIQVHPAKWIQIAEIMCLAEMSWWIRVAQIKSDSRKGIKKSLKMKNLCTDEIQCWQKILGCSLSSAASLWHCGQSLYCAILSQRKVVQQKESIR